MITMKKCCLSAIVLASVLASCSSDSLVDDSASSKSNQTPIAFSVQKQNITRGVNLETTNHYNFGVWAWKIGGKNSLNDAEVMNNYLVGYSDGSSVGYDKTNATTWADNAGTQGDHTSAWFYENLGTAEYTTPGTGFISDNAYLSNNANQYLRYWDLAYANTNFYCYAPYVKEDASDATKKVTFAHVKDGTSTMTFAANTIRDGYDNPVNTAYDSFDRSLSEFMYAGVKAVNADLKDVIVPFKHMGAQLNIQFYEDIPGYKVEIIDLGADHGAMKTGLTEDMAKGIQLTPAVAPAPGDAYTLGEYYTTSGATVTFNDADVSSEGATYTADYTGSTKVSTPLMFAVPNSGLTNYTGLDSNTHKVIKEKVTTGTQEYSTSPTVYYTVAQPKEDASEFTKSGFTIHVTYRIIAEDNKEVITVHNATVFIPYKDSSDKLITIWEPNTRYTYTFKITRDTTGTSNPEGEIDPTDPTPSTTKALYPIVFDGATIEDYTVVENEPVLSENTNY